MISTKKVADNFSRGADIYDRNARCQMHAAKRLACMMFKECPVLPGGAKVLELGCGTGFLTEKLFTMYPAADFTVTDISRKMLARCKGKASRLGCGRRRFILTDFDSEIPRGRFDAVVSGMSFQWSSDLEALASKLHRILPEGGRLFFSMIIEPTFRELKETFKEQGLKYPGPRLLAESEVQKCFSMFNECRFSSETWCDTYKSTSEFLKHLNRIGAGNPTNMKLSAGNLRRIIRAHNAKFARGGEIEAVYRITYGMAVK